MFINNHLIQEFKYVKPKLYGLLNEISNQLLSFDLFVIRVNDFEYKVSHAAIGCIAHLLVANQDIILTDIINNRKYVLTSVNDLHTYYINCLNEVPLSEFITNLSNVITVSKELSNDNITSLVTLLQYLILQNGLSMYVSQRSLGKGQLLRFEDFNNTRSIIVTEDALYDQHMSKLNSELDILLYLHI